MNESIRLLSTKNGADKEYRVQIESFGDGYIVTGFNGRRGGPLKAQPKVESPLPYAEAKAVYDALVASAALARNLVLLTVDARATTTYAAVGVDFEVIRA